MLPGHCLRQLAGPLPKSALWGHTSHPPSPHHAILRLSYPHVAQAAGLTAQTTQTAHCHQRKLGWGWAAGSLAAVGQHPGQQHQHAHRGLRNTEHWLLSKQSLHHTAAAAAVNAEAVGCPAQRMWGHFWEQAVSAASAAQDWLMQVDAGCSACWQFVAPLLLAACTVYILLCHIIIHAASGHCPCTHTCIASGS